MDPGGDRPRVPRTTAGGVPDSHLRARQANHRSRRRNVRELWLLDQLFYRPAPRLRVGWLTTEWPAISHFDMAGLFIRNVGISSGRTRLGRQDNRSFSPAHTR